MLVVKIFSSLNEVVCQVDQHQNCCQSGGCHKPDQRRYESDAEDVENHATEAHQGLYLAARALSHWDPDVVAQITRL